ncbi:UbiD family decarboxylase domain-containing protein [Nocardia sp. NPDC059091]|uniref:UbiD family decarboxylase domain-containing protein n=1 Tax=unclassified Nocardia TaxID=2637762 RepID=UPI003682E3D5
MVPATAEIVIEGCISLDETVMEGPMNEFPGYNAAASSPKHLFTVTAITHRDNAILPVVAAGGRWRKTTPAPPPCTARNCSTSCARPGCRSPPPGTPEAAMHWLTLSVRQDWHETLGISSAELVQRIADVAFTGKASVNAPKIVLVEDDVDITNLNEVVWAFATRSHPDVERGEFHFPHRLSDDLPVYLDDEEKHTYMAGKVIYNCLLADLYPDGKRPVKGSFENGWPTDIQERVLANRRAYGYR